MPHPLRRALSSVAVLALVAAILAALLTTTRPAEATTIVTWTVEGVIDRVDYELRDAGVSLGDPFVLTFSFDTAATDTSDADPQRGDYYELIADAHVTIGDAFTATASPPGGAALLESYSFVFDGWDGTDRWELRTHEGWTADTLNGHEIVVDMQQLLRFYDADATAFDSDALPTSPPDLAPFEDVWLSLVFREPSSSINRWIEGDVRSIGVAGPEPVNSPPTVDAGANVSGTTDTPIALDAAVSDPDGDPLTTTWTVDDPACDFADAAAVDTTITCAAAGTYVATLTADDGINPAVSDTTEVTVDEPPTSDDDVDTALETARAGIEALSRPSFKSGGHQTAMLSILDDVEALLDVGEFAEADALIADLMRHVDGCGTGSDRDDWIIDCGDQLAIRDSLQQLRIVIGALIA